MQWGKFRAVCGSFEIVGSKFGLLQHPTCVGLVLLCMLAVCPGARLRTRFVTLCAKILSNRLILIELDPKARIQTKFVALCGTELRKRWTQHPYTVHYARCNPRNDTSPSPRIVRNKSFAIAGRVPTDSATLSQGSPLRRERRSARG
jgi:hypothetical protein